MGMTKVHFVWFIDVNGSLHIIYGGDEILSNATRSWLANKMPGLLRFRINSDHMYVNPWRLFAYGFLSEKRKKRI